MRREGRIPAALTAIAARIISFAPFIIFLYLIRLRYTLLAAASISFTAPSMPRREVLTTRS